MRFTRLRLNGFKSFVDPTELVIADGLTGVVGPNGCGKSNLLEALRWVMGENRPTAMRGDGMEDVIFAGAATRSARNFAEVSLQIDNGERRAPPGFNDNDTLDIVRRITRDAGSAYKANTRDVRARDVQMLFADASTGSHSPALVRQGQISELINAKPKARRRILEEAAGISGLYQRRHEAELKLKGAESNLLRVDDVIEQLAAQLAQLSRQARQAARYRDISERLRQAEGTLLYRRWKEADLARLEVEAELRARTSAAAQAEAAARNAAQHRAEQDQRLPALREEEVIASALLQRLTVQRDQLKDDAGRARGAIEALRGRIAQLDRDEEREAGLNTDAEKTVAALRQEAEALRLADTGHGDALNAAAAEAADAARILQEREAALAEGNEDVARLAARHHAAQRMCEDTAKTLARSEEEAARAERVVQDAAAARDALAGALEQAEAEQEAALRTATRAEETLAEADEARAAAQAREADARAEHSEAEGEAGALRAEVAALGRLVERDTAEDGQVLDAMQVDAGFEKALGAALADDLRMPELEPGRRSGWMRLPGYNQEQALPRGVGALSDHVRAPSVMQRRMSQIGLVSREDGPALQAKLLPGQRLVSREGDLWRWDGFCSGAEDAPSAAALRLQQLNRLVELKRDLEEASARARGAAQAHTMLKTRLGELTEADRLARNARRDADKLVAETGRALSRAEAERSISLTKLEGAELAVTRHRDEAREARQRLSEAQQVLAGLDDLDAARGALDDIKMTVEAARVTMLSRRSFHDELRREGDERARRLEQIDKEIAGWQERLETAGARIAELEQRRGQAQASLQAAEQKPAQIAAEREKLDRSMEEAERRRRHAAEKLAEAETAQRQAEHQERDAERAASEARESRAAAAAREEGARETVELARRRIAEEQESTPEALIERLQADPDTLGAADAIETEVNKLKRQRDALGAVNLRAEEDAREVASEHDSLVREKGDLEEAIRALRHGIASLNREGRERLLTAFEQVNSNFAMLFTHLFGGGEAKLVLVESDDPLEAGLEIMCQPPGKRLSTLSLLSGGEQTLTALALIFAVFLANPAPICVLDEVDAPLDDANVTRFCDLLDEMTRRANTRFLIITHHAVTMSRMDRLFGVTMAEQGVSQLVSVDLKKAEALVA